MDGLQIVHHHVDHIERCVLVSLDCHACTVLDLVGQVGVVGLTHGLHPHLEFCGLRLILVPCDRNSCHVVWIIVLALQPLVHLGLSFRLRCQVEELAHLVEGHAERTQFAKSIFLLRSEAYLVLMRLVVNLAYFVEKRYAHLFVTPVG